MTKDTKLFDLIESEKRRQMQGIELIASENIVSPAVMMAMGTCLTNKYAEGYPGKRYYGGCYCVDETEEIARQRACKLFGAEHANVQPHSGASANLAAFKAMLQPGDTYMGMNLAHGGHLSHGSPVNISGQYFHQVPYSLNDETEQIDYDELYRIAQECKPKMILAGASAYPRKIDFAKFREIADSVGAYLMVDMAHIAGLVAAGVHMSPVPYADVVTSTTHKTLRGPRGGLILCKNEITKKNIETGEMETINLAKKIDSAVFPGTQGGPLEHIIAAKAICFGEALKPEFKAYGEQVVKNAAVLADGLMKEGFRLVSGGTDNHLMLVDVRNFNITGKADVQGGAEAVKSSLEKLSNDEVRVQVIHSGVGAINESDVMLASTSQAIIVGFNVRPDAAARDSAARANVDMRMYRVIYDAINEIEAAMKGMLAPKFREVLLGHAEVRQTYKVSGVGTVAGCYVQDGKLQRKDCQVRLVRDGIVVHEGVLASLQRFKDSVKEVPSGYECGLSIEKFNDIKEGDVVEAFTMEQIQV